MGSIESFLTGPFAFAPLTFVLCFVLAYEIYGRICTARVHKRLLELFDEAETRIKANPPQCRYCKGFEFIKGPRGGAAINILCADIECRHWFNFIPMANLLEDLNKTASREEYRVGDKDESR